MFNDLVIAICRETDLLRHLGEMSIHFTIEVHLSQITMDRLYLTDRYKYDIENMQFMGHPIIKDSTDYVCIVHKINLVDRENENGL